VASSSAARGETSCSGSESLEEDKRQVQDFSGKTRCYIFSDGRVQALRAVLISVALCLYTAEALDPLLERDQ